MISRQLLRTIRGLNTLPRVSFSIFGKTDDIISKVTQDHRELETYFKNYKAAKSEEDSYKWFNLFVWEISRHSVAEEQILYQLLEAQGDKGKKLAQKSREDHREMKKALEDLRQEKDPKKFDEKFKDAFKDLEKHLSYEEKEDLPFLKEKLSEKELIAAGKAFTMKEKLAPTRPHPSVPDKPAALELALGLMIAPVDKFRDLFTSFPDKDTTKA